MPRFRPRLSYQPDIPSPMTFFGHLKWIDGRKLSNVIEPYRAQLFEQALYSFEPDGAPTYTMCLSGRAKKNWKSADLVLASFYRFFVWPVQPQGNDCYIIASDEGQAADDLSLAKLLVRQNKILADECEVQNKRISRADGRGILTILPAGDVSGSHGKTYGFLGVDEAHTYKDWGILEALQPDPTRRDTLQWITTYDGLYHREGAPLFDLMQQAKRGADSRMYFSWYSALYCTDTEHDRKSCTAEERANPSMSGWADQGYLKQQKARLPSHRYRRLHLNIGGQPEGAAFDANALHACVVPKRKSLKPEPDRHYTGFVDPSGGSSDSFTIGIAHALSDRVVLDLVDSQRMPTPFDPRVAVMRHSATLKKYGITRVYGDAYAGQTFAKDFEAHGITYLPVMYPKSQLYERLEPIINAGEVELLDKARLLEQLLGLVWRGRKIDHVPGNHDDWANSAAGALVCTGRQVAEPHVRSLFDPSDEPISPQRQRRLALGQEDDGRWLEGMR